MTRFEGMSREAVKAKVRELLSTSQSPAAVERLVADLAKALGALEEENRELRGANARLLDSRVDSRREPEQRPIRESVRRANDATPDRGGNEFLASIAHDLRTHLNVIHVWTQILRRDPNPAQWDEALDATEESVQRLTRLIDELLRLSRGSRGPREIDQSEG